MKIYFYLTLTPESLIASMLPPEDFGNYMATGTHKRTRGQAIFFQIDQSKIQDLIPQNYIKERCIPQEKNRPKSTVYISIYRVLESVPIDAYLGLYLTTDDGRVLKLEQAEYLSDVAKEMRLYQELCPVTPRVVSTMEPHEFGHFITNPKNQIYLPKLVFCDLKLGELADNPEDGHAEDLPYPNVEHLRDCLKILKFEEGKSSKTVIRFFQGDLLFRTVKTGFFVCEQEKILFYKFPTINELENKHYAWWRSALSVGFH